MRERLRRWPGALLAAPLATAAAPARAHHGSASVSIIGVDGPGAGLETTTPLPLGQGRVLVLGDADPFAPDMQTGSRGPMFATRI